MHPLSFAAAARWLYTQNPFYLVGALVMLCGLQQALGGDETLSTCTLKMALLGGFALTLAAIAVLIVRWGGLWDDARTLLLVIVLVLLLLSACVDLQLLEAFHTGAAMLAAGWLFAVLLSAGLLYLLRLPLGVVYCGPYFLLLTLFFAFPLAPAWLRHEGLDGLRDLATLAFPALMAAGILTLWPAAGLPASDRCQAQLAARGAPWRWPYYPWSLFVFLTLGLVVRAWWLAVSFDPAKGTGSPFSVYYLFPVAVAWGLLVLRMGVVRGSRWAQLAGLALPTVFLAAAFPGTGGVAVEAAFLAQLTQYVSPVQLVLGGLMCVASIAWLLDVRGAEGLLAAAATGMAFVDRTTLSFGDWTEPQPRLLAAVGGGLLLLAIRRDSLAWALAGACAGGLAYQATGWKNSFASDDFLLWHLPVLCLAAGPAVFQSPAAKRLRELIWPLIPVAAAAGVVAYPWLFPEARLSSQSAWFAALAGVAALHWLRLRHAPALGGVLVCVAACGVMQLRLGYRVLEATQLAGGLPWFAVGGGMVAVGLAISLSKMGVWRRCRDAVLWCNERLDALLGGEPRAACVAGGEGETP